jgi:Protein of unknown function (DUF3054)
VGLAPALLLAKDTIMAIKNQIATRGEVNSTPTSSNIRRTVFLVIGDTIVFLVFAFIGTTSHKEAIDPVKIVTTAAPFALGWFIVAPFIGAFSRKKTTGVRKMALYTVLAWLPSLVLGMVFRGITVDHKVPPTSFMIVALISNTIFLLIWRVPFAWLTGKRK